MARAGLAGGMRQQGRGPVDQMIFVEESHSASVALPLFTLGTRGSCHHAAGHAGREGAASFPASSGVSSISPSGTQSRRPARTSLRCGPGPTRRRRMGHHGREALHERHPVRRLRLARRSNRPRGTQAPGVVGVPGADGCRRLQLDPAPDDRGGVHQRHLLRRRAGPRRQPGRRGERRLGHHDQPAQPGAGRHLSGGGHSRAPSKRSGAGQRSIICPMVAA